MKGKGLFKAWILAAVIVLNLAAPGFTLDAKIVRNINRAATSEDLLRIADSVANDAATRQPKDFEEGTQIASEVSAYLLYIIARQNAMLLERQEDTSDTR